MCNQESGIEMKKYFVCVIVLLSLMSIKLSSYEKSTLTNKQIENEISQFRKYVIEENIDKVSEYFDFPIQDKDILQVISINSNYSVNINKINKEEFKLYYDYIITKKIESFIQKTKQPLINKSLSIILKDSSYIFERKSLKSKVTLDYGLRTLKDKFSYYFNYNEKKYKLHLNKKYIEEDDYADYGLSIIINFKIVQNKIKIVSFIYAG